MELSPLDITQREFSRKFRGLDPEEVHTFLEQIAEAMTRLQQENTDRAGQIQRLEGQVRILQEREDSLRSVLISAQKMSEELKTNAKREGDLLMKEAELMAERLLEQAHRKLAQVQAEIGEFERQRSLFAAKLRGLVKSHLELLDAQLDKPGTPGVPAE
jgi:cell division initiation protein